MPISTGIPTSWKLPLFWASVDGSQAGFLTENEPAILVGQYNATGSNAGTIPDGVNVPVPVGSPALGDLYFGAGSMLARMIRAFFAVNTNQLLYVLPVADPSAGVKAAGSILVTGTPTASGVLSIYIAGQLVQISVASTDTVSSIATNLAAAINANAQLPVVATVAAATVTLTCNWKGLTGNDITIIPNYLGSRGGQLMPAGVGLTITAMTSGAGEPVFTPAIAAIQMLEFDYCGMPYTDTASMASWNTEYGFGAGGRWNYQRQQYGQIWNAFRDDYADALTWGMGNNSPVMSTMAIEPLVPSPVWEVCAAYCGAAALGFSDDPARPLQTLELLGILPATLQNRFSQAEQNNLASSGLAVQGVDPAGNMMILVEQTQYQLNSFGQADSAFGLATVLSTLAELLRRMKSAVTTKWPRVKLVPDGTKLGPGQAAVTPSSIKAELISEYNQAIFDGLVSDQADFANNLQVEIDDENPNRIDVLWPPYLAGQLRQFTALAQFRLLVPPQSAA